MGWRSWTRAVKAEIALAFRLVVRHRAPRVAGALALGVAVGRVGAAAPAEATRQLAVVVGVLMATAASRPLARGAACASVWRSGARPALVVVARLGGAWLAVSWVAAAVAAALFAALDRDTARALAAAAGLGTAIGALVLGLAPALGASGAAALGIVVAVAGAASPTDLEQVLAAGPAGHLVRLVLVALPTAWRGSEWYVHGGVGHLLVLAAWIGAGVGVAALGLRRRGDGAG